jgi:catechol 2,3-dioxygenase-like lactoylglutathione lyase family enzyme
MEGVFHTGVTVSDLDRSIPFYRDVLGLELLVEPMGPSSGEEFSEALGVPEASVRLAVFRVGDGSLELLEYLNPESPVECPLPPNALGAMHVAFQVRDVYAEVERLKARGVVFNSRVQAIDEGPLAGWRWVYFKDPDGINLELIQIVETA